MKVKCFQVYSTCHVRHIWMPKNVWVAFRKYEYQRYSRNSIEHGPGSVISFKIMFNLGTGRDIHFSWFIVLTIYFENRYSRFTPNRNHENWFHIFELSILQNNIVWTTPILNLRYLDGASISHFVDVIRFFTFMFTMFDLTAVQWPTLDLWKVEFAICFSILGNNPYKLYKKEFIAFLWKFLYNFS